MSVHPVQRQVSYLVRNSSTSGRDDETAIYGGTGVASGGTLPTGQTLGSTQAAIRLRGDAPDAGSLMEITTDGGTSWDAVATVPGTGRVGLSWVAGARGKPGINADILNASEAVRMVTDPYFEILGTNASSDDVTYNAEGGITFTTDGADGDEVILLPHLDANQSAWTQWTWGTDKSVRWSCLIETGAAITNSIVWAGLKLTNTDVAATDDDQAFVRYEDGVNDGEFQVITSIGGTDTTTDSGIVVAVSTRYKIEIVIDAARLCKVYINGVLQVTTAALTDATDLIPYIAVAADGAAEAKTLTVYGASISRSAG